MPTAEQVAAGAAAYSPRMLRLYDLLVLRISNPWIWRCPTRRLLAWYDEHSSANHLDVGVGTGYFLDKCRLPGEAPRLALLDLNANCLAAAAARVARYQPRCFTANVLEPIELDVEKFDSIGLNYLLHCLPGSLAEKAVAMRHLARLLNPGGVMFGSTILQGGVRRGWAARRLMALYNRKQIFSNTDDDLAGLERALADHLTETTLRVVGCVALFAGRAASQ